MKVKAIERMLVSERHVLIINGKEQWVAAKGAIYPLHGFPRMNEDAVFAWLDVPANKRSGYYFEEVERNVTAYDYSDQTDDERVIERDVITVTTAEGTYVPLRVTDGVIYVNEKYLKPYKGDAALYERRTENGAIYIVVKEGLILKGIILPVKMREKFTYDLLDIARLTRMAKDYIASEAE